MKPPGGPHLRLAKCNSMNQAPTPQAWHCWRGARPGRVRALALPRAGSCWGITHLHSGFLGPIFIYLSPHDLTISLFFISDLVVLRASPSRLSPLSIFGFKLSQRPENCLQSSLGQEEGGKGLAGAAPRPALCNVHLCAVILGARALSPCQLPSSSDSNMWRVREKDVKLVPPSVENPGV